MNEFSCSCLSEPPAAAVTRRRLLTRASAVALAAGASVAGLVPGTAFADARDEDRDRSAGRRRTRLTLLGTAAGPVIRGRKGIASALLVEDVAYLIDCGMECASSFRLTGHEWRQLRHVFLTHLHSDHVLDYPSVLLVGWGSPEDQVAPGVQVWGPGRPDDLPPVRGGREVPVIAPELPMPGTEDTTRLMFEAFAWDINMRLRDEGRRDIRTLFLPNDIAVPDVGGSTHGPWAPLMEPFLVMEDDRVRVTAILVDHRPVFPAFGFRFDTDDGSIVFSGDTARTPNMVRLARNADILVHEVVNIAYYRRTLPPGPPTDAFIGHLSDSHTPVDEVGLIAQEANVKHLVLSHFAPGDPRAVPSAEWRREARRNWRGRLTVGEDWDVLGLGPRVRR
jgi:ribonuclease BN (tRNA processing enzyme)